MESRTTGVGDADRDVQMFLVRIAGTLGELLGDELVGLYVRGALARGRFRRDNHGLELLAVVARKLPPELHESVARTLVRLSDARPVRGDLDVTIIEQEYDRSDETLGAQIADVRDCGVRIVGPPAKDLFEATPSPHTR